MPTRTVLDVLGDPESWLTKGQGGMLMQLLRGATIVATQEGESDVVSVVMDARGQLCSSTFVIEDPATRQRLLEILQPGLLMLDCLDREL
jgi:hypothetical protein